MKNALKRAVATIGLAGILGVGALGAAAPASAGVWQQWRIYGANPESTCTYVYQGRISKNWYAAWHQWNIVYYKDEFGRFYALCSR